MAYLDRFGVSMDAELLAAFDGHLAERGYANRSEALRDLVREALARTRLRESSAGAMGVLSLVVEAGSGGGEAEARTRRLLADAGEAVVGALHVPLGPVAELRVLILRGPAATVEKLAGELRALRHVTHAELHLLPTE